MSDINEVFHSINWIGSPLNTDGSGTGSLFRAILSWRALARDDIFSSDDETVTLGGCLLGAGEPL